MPKLKESSIRLISYGTSRSLELLGKAKCLITAEAGVETITLIYEIRGAQELLLGLRDAQTLGILKINLDGKLARTSEDPPPRIETGGRQTHEQCRENGLPELGKETQSYRHAVTKPIEEWWSSWKPKLNFGTHKNKCRDDALLELGKEPQSGRHVVTKPIEEHLSS